MGPVNTKIQKGRGDATIALKNAGEALREQQNIFVLSKKLDLLSEQEVQELTEILDGADVNELLFDRSEIELFLTDYEETE